MMPWRRTYAEWDRDNKHGWYPTTTNLEPWPSYLRRIYRRLWWLIQDHSGWCA